MENTIEIEEMQLSEELQIEEVAESIRATLQADQ